jgi:hypothetical protein
MSRSKLITAGLLLALGVSSVPVAWAQRDAAAKIRGDYGIRSNTPSRGRSRRYVYRYSAPTYLTAPRMVTPAPASPEVAQAPTQRRAFSYAPSTEGQAAAGSAPAAQYYEPAPRYNSAPSVRRSSRTPAFLLPKTDPRRFR